jgi:tyrosyl-tRNA synthetase
MQEEIARQMAVLERGTAEIIPREELEKKIGRSIVAGQPLKIKLGLDPTAPDIHLGHTVVLNKLRQFQDLGHEVNLLIGDFTGRIGDPSGKNETRKQLTEEQVLVNSRTYQEQIFKVLDPEKTKVHFNSTWLTPLKLADILGLAAKYTVARMMERDDFAKRYKENLPISIHEFMYPLMQGYDSVALTADVELGGTDQKFNLLVGRHLQREYGQEPQVALTMPILEGIDGVQKMSKSLGNYIGVSEEPNEMFGKIMSIPDSLIARYFELLTMVPMEEVRQLETDMAAGNLNPRDAKVRLAKVLISRYHSEAAAEEAEQRFILIFNNRDIPEDIPEFTVTETEIFLPKFLQEQGLVASSSDARRLIQQGGCKVDGEKYSAETVTVRSGMVIQAGKRKFLRLIIGE